MNEIMVTRFKHWFCFLGSVKLIKNADSDQYKYSGSSIAFKSRSESSLPDGSMGKNVTIFGSWYELICVYW